MTAPHTSPRTSPHTPAHGSPHTVPHLAERPRHRPPLRLRLGEQSARDSLDGAWWPYSRDLTVELADLVDGFPAELGRAQRVLYSPPDWDVVARRIDVGRGYVKAGCFPHDDTHQLVVQTSHNTRVHLLVVPPGLTAYQAEEAMLAACTPRNAHTGGELLHEVTDHHDVRAEEMWAESTPVQSTPVQSAPVQSTPRQRGSAD